MVVERKSDYALDFVAEENPLKNPWMGPARIRHPSFSAAPLSMTATSSATPGPGPMSLLKCYGAMDRSIKNGTRFRKGTPLI